AYAVRAVDDAGEEVRVIVDARLGRIVKVVPLMEPRYAMPLLRPPAFGRPPRPIAMVPDGGIEGPMLNGPGAAGPGHIAGAPHEPPAPGGPPGPPRPAVRAVAAATAEGDPAPAPARSAGPRRRGGPARRSQRHQNQRDHRYGHRAGQPRDGARRPV